MQRIPIVGAGTLLLAACGGSGGSTAPPAPVVSVTVTPGTATVVGGGTLQLTATLKDAAGTVLAGRTVTWASSDIAVATVAIAGLMKGVAPGSVTITATSEGQSGMATITVNLVFAEVSAGNIRTCGVTTKGAAYCWGLNNDGQLGNGTTVDSPTPVAVVGGLAFKTVVAGGEGSHTCGITTNGAAYCWGNDSAGQLGDGTTTNSAMPVAVAGGLTFTSLTLHFSHTCGITATGLAYCWGGNSTGQLGTGTTTASTVPVAVTGGLAFAAVAAGYYHTCGVTAGGVAYCWGVGDQLGTGSPAESDVPAAVAGGLTFATITAGSFDSCGLTANGAAFCWGFNTNGSLGDGTTNSSAVPVAVTGGFTFSALRAGFAHTCGVTTDHAAYCWGDNGSGEVGSGSATGSGVLTPAAVVGGLTFAGVSTGALHTCGVTTSGIGYCWGLDGTGQLGDGTTTESAVPVKVVDQP